MTMSQLARALDAPVDDVVAWEAGEKFPTKKMVGRLEALLARHREAAPPPPLEQPGSPAPPWDGLADPGLWLLFRKLAAYPKLRAEALQLAASYPDPAASDDPH